MPRPGGRERRDFVLYSVLRPLLLVLWVLVLWGTVYALLFLHASWAKGPAGAWRQALSGADPLGGRLNLVLAGAAALVWALLAVAACVRRSRGRRDEATARR